MSRTRNDRDRVRDDGPGIPQSLLPAVFERFTRGDASRFRASATSGGSGLGLAIAAAITSAHGGRIGVDSEPGRTEFTIVLPPAGTAQLPPVDAISAPSVPARKPTPTPTSPPPQAAPTSRAPTRA